MRTTVFLLFVAVLLYSCNRPPRDVRLVLNAAGDNRSELEKVIDHYRSSLDKEKLKAAYFLIGNMEGKYALDGPDVRKYDGIFGIFDSISKSNTLLPSESPVINSKWDSIVKVFGPPSPKINDAIFDYSHIKADYLIKNIDLSFKLRDESPWSKKFSFEQFCEFILAYRLHHEPLEPWRSDFYEKYKSLRDSVNADSVIQLARVVEQRFHSFLRLSYILKEYPFDIPLGKMKLIRYQACPHVAVYSGMVMRSVGLPVAIDYAKWANHPATHSWNALLLENGKSISFEGYLNKFKPAGFRKIAKVYRETFGIQNIGLAENNKDVPVSLSDKYHIDVTNEYVEALNIRVPLKYPFLTKKKYAIICTFNNRDWIAQDWGKIEKREACFKNIGTGVVYLVMYYDNGSLYPASDPFILTKDGQVSFLITSKAKLQDMLLIRKYDYFNEIKDYLNNMLGGTFQGANNTDFSDSVVLYTVTKSPEKVETALIENPLKFRYVRYRAPFKGSGDIAELEFYGGGKGSDTLKLIGKVIGFPEISPSLSTPYGKAFDANLETYFGRNKRGLSWVGLDLGTPKRITKIRYCPRSDTNFILVGDTYELCYWDNREWVSMGEQVAKEQYLIYKNVPSGGLYILHNLTRGKEERIFTYEEDRQIWW